MWKNEEVELALIKTAIGYTYEEQEVIEGNIKTIEKYVEPNNESETFWYEINGIDAKDSNVDMLRERAKELKRIIKNRSGGVNS